MKNANDLDWNRLKISKRVYEKSRRKRLKQLERYRDNFKDDQRCRPVNPTKYDNIVDVMRRRKMEKECQRVRK